MRKQCLVCTKSFEAKRAAAKYCSDRCRKRAQRTPAQPHEPTPTAAPATHPSDALQSATRAELEAAGRLESAAGQAAMVLARRIDEGDAETGAAMAAMVREHRAALEAALKKVKKAADPIDELRQRRERKKAGGAVSRSRAAGASKRAAVSSNTRAGGRRARGTGGPST